MQEYDISVQECKLSHARRAHKESACTATIYHAHEYGNGLRAGAVSGSINSFDGSIRTRGVFLRFALAVATDALRLHLNSCKSSVRAACLPVHCKLALQRPFACLRVRTRVQVLTEQCRALAWSNVHFLS